MKNAPAFCLREDANPSPKNTQPVAACRGLLTGARSFRREEPSRAETAQIAHNGAVSGCDQWWQHLVIAARIVWEAMNQQHGEAGVGTAILVCDFQGAEVCAF